MPTLSRYCIKTGLLYFVIAMLAGALLMLQPVLNLTASLQALRPVYIHLLTVGWITQLIIGVVFWMFPKYSKEHPRGSERLGWFVYAALNTGLILRAIGEPLLAIHPSWNVGWMVALSALLQVLAGWAFVANTWGRVKER